MFSTTGVPSSNTEAPNMDEAHAVRHAAREEADAATMIYCALIGAVVAAVLGSQGTFSVGERLGIVAAGATSGVVFGAAFNYANWIPSRYSSDDEDQRGAKARAGIEIEANPVT